MIHFLFSINVKLECSFSCLFQDSAIRKLSVVEIKS